MPEVAVGFVAAGEALVERGPFLATPMLAEAALDAPARLNGRAEPLRSLEEVCDLQPCRASPKGDVVVRFLTVCDLQTLVHIEKRY